MIDLRVLGALELRSTGGIEGRSTPTQPKRLALLLYLVLAEPFGLHARDRLLALLWPEADDSSSRHSLRNALHALRQALGDDVIVARGEAYVGVAAGAIRCDALELRDHLGAGRLEEGLALWSGELAPGFHVSGAPEFEQWLDEQRAQLRRSVRAAAWKRARELEGTGQAEVDAMRRASRLDPGDEPGVRSLMRLLAASGDSAGAMRAYQALTEHLARELETEPSAETRALASSLRSTNATKRDASPTGASETDSTIAPVLAVPASPALAVPRKRSKPIARLAFATGALALVAYAAEMRGAWRPRTERAPQTEVDLAVLRLPAAYRRDTSAYASYMRGLALRFEFRFRAARDTFASLEQRKPTYVPGLYGLAHAYGLLVTNDSVDAEEGWPKVEELAQRALALDSTAASAWLTLAGEDLHWHIDLGRARERLDRAQQLDSRDPDLAALRSVWFRHQGEMDSAVAQARLANRLDPLSRYYERLYAKQLYFAQRFDSGKVVYARMLRDDPNWTRGYEDFAQLNFAMGNPREAVEWYRRARTAAGDSVGAQALPSTETDSAARRLLAADARRRIERLSRLQRAGIATRAWSFAVAYAQLVDTAAVLRWLDSIAVRHDDMVFNVPVDPVFNFLRNDPRYRSWESRNVEPARARTIAR